MYKNMSRYFIDCAYLGSKYVGWQRQLNGISVQEEIERALLVVFQEEIKIHGSSRTDAGVHALHQFAHVDLPDKFSSLEEITYKLNNLLPKDISINELTQIPEEIHARFEAIGRKYVYRIHTFKDPFNAEISYYFRQSLNVERMNTACKVLLKSTDFESFSKVKTAVNNFICKIEIAEWTTDGAKAYQDLNGDVGGQAPMNADPPNASRDGYETLVFDEGIGNDPDAVWIRRDSGNPNNVQLAFKYGLIGNDPEFAFGGWADDGLKNPGAFDYNDFMTFDEAGSAYSQNNRYPINHL
jgi:tRNA pseudouridine38-40 synthase